MAANTQSPVPDSRPARLSLFASKIEHMIEWAEPIIREVCQEVWREARPRGLEIEDLYQEGRIAVFQAAREIASATDHAAMVATVVRCQAVDALRLLADWDTPPQADEEEQPPEDEAPIAAG